MRVWNRHTGMQTHTHIDCWNNYCLPKSTWPPIIISCCDTFMYPDCHTNCCITRSRPSVLCQMLCQSNIKTAVQMTNCPTHDDHTSIECNRYVCVCVNTCVWYIYTSYIDYWPPNPSTKVCQKAFGGNSINLSLRGSLNCVEPTRSFKYIIIIFANAVKLDLKLCNIHLLYGKREYSQLGIKG